ncbi:MAG: chemotaxis protein CheR [Deltaproteobacteria bacterium]|nr:chemotaxis protein CheR [Deltaproteobacteria bacterium]
MTFDRFLQEACPGLGLVWRKYRRRSSRHRVDARLLELGLEGYRDYLERIRSDAQEAALLPDLMRVTVSRFFREQKQWLELKDHVLPELIATISGVRPLSIWSAGCCGGEEPFTLALLWLEYIRPFHPGWSVEILATDIDEASLERARRSLYRWETLREVPDEIRTRWFSQANALWRLDGKATALVRFGKRNLLTDPPPRGMDLTLCRYLAFTYFKGERLRVSLLRLWESLRPGGVLMVGEKEVLPASVLEYFEPMPGSRVFYRRIG